MLARAKSVLESGTGPHPRACHASYDGSTTCNRSRRFGNARRPPRSP